MCTCVENFAFPIYASARGRKIVNNLTNKNMFYVSYNVMFKNMLLVVIFTSFELKLG